MIDSTFSIYRTNKMNWKLFPLEYVCKEVKKRNTLLLEENLLSLSYGKIINKDILTNEGLLPESFDGYNIVERGDVVLRLTDLQNDKRSLRTGRVLEDGIITSAYTTVRPTGVDSRWLALSLHCYDIQKIFYALGSGLRQSMKFSDLKSLAIAVPPIEQQINIVDFLEHELMLIENLLSSLMKLKESSIQLGKSLTFEEINLLGNSSQESLGKLCNIYQPKTIPSTELLEDGKYPVYGANGIIGSYDKYNHTDSELLLTCRGGSCGEINVSVPFSWINGNAMVIKPKSSNLDVNFLKYVLSDWVDIQSVITGSAQPQITGRYLRHLLIPVPSLETQKEIVAKLNNVMLNRQTQLNVLDETITRVTEYRASLITEAITGSLDIKTKRSVA